jgi:hypothetical protein
MGKEIQREKKKRNEKGRNSSYKLKIIDLQHSTTSKPCPQGTRKRCA